MKADHHALQDKRQNPKRNDNKTQKKGKKDSSQNPQGLPKKKRDFSSMKKIQNQQTKATHHALQDKHQISKRKAKKTKEQE